MAKYDTNTLKYYINSAPIHLIRISKYIHPPLYISAGPQLRSNSVFSDPQLVRSPIIAYRSSTLRPIAYSYPILRSPICNIAWSHIAFHFGLRNLHRVGSPGLYTRMCKYIGSALSHHSFDMPELHLARLSISGLSAIAISAFWYAVHWHIHFPICDHSSVVRSTPI